jgi:hypothetical protein
LTLIPHMRKIVLGLWVPLWSGKAVESLGRCEISSSFNCKIRNEVNARRPERETVTRTLRERESRKKGDRGRQLEREGKGEHETA